MYSSGMPVPGSCSTSSAGTCPASAISRRICRVRLPGPGHPVELGRLPGLLAFLQREPAYVGRPEEGSGAHPVHLDVVRVPVAAEGVVGGQHLGAVAADEAHQAAHRLHEIGPAEGAGVVVLRGARHARVAVAQQLHRGHAEDGAGGAQFRLADFTQALPHRLGVVVVEDLPHLAPGGGDHHHLLAGGGVARQGAAHRERLVVGVGVEGEETGHGGAA